MGIAKIIVAYGDSLREDVFKDHVGKMSVKSIIRTARERRPGALGYSEAMMLAYNAKNKYHLSLKTLYGGKSVTNDPDEEYGIENLTYYLSCNLNDIEFKISKVGFHWN